MKKGLLKKVALLFCLLALVLFAASCANKDAAKPSSSETSPTEPAKTVQMRLVTGSAAGDPMTVRDEEMAKRFNERAGGAYIISVHPGDSIVKTPELMDAVRTGAVEMMATSWTIFSGKDEKLEAACLPFLFDNANAVAAAAQDIVELYTPLLQEKFNQKPLGFYYVGFNDLIGTKPVKTMADWKSWLTGSPDPPSAKMIEALGGNAISVPWNEIYSAMSKGVIDNMVMGNYIAVDFKLTDIIKTSTQFYGISGNSAYSINLDVWNKMPKDIQDILVEEAQRTAEDKSKFSIDRMQEDLNIYKSKGIESYVLPADERAKWKAAVQPYVDGKLDSMGDFGKKMKEIADKANKANPQ